MTENIDMNTDEVSLIAPKLYANVVGSGPIDVHSATVTWLDKTGEKLYMKVGKVLAPNA